MFDPTRLPTSEDVPSTPLSAALRECEEFCIAPCCGMAAFNIAVEPMQRWANSATAVEVDQAKHEVDVALEALRSAPDWFHFLYDSMSSRREVTDWYRKIATVLGEVQPTPSGPNCFGGLNRDGAG